MTFEDQIVRASFTGATTADVAEVSLPGMSGAMVQLGGTFVATVTFEVLVDEGTSPTWRAICGTSVTTPTAASTATTAGTYQFNVSGARRFRARCSAFTSGTVTVAVNVSRGSGGTPCPTLASGSTTAVTGGPVIVVGQTAGGASETANSVSIGFVGTGATHRNATAAPSLSNTTGVDVLGVGPMLKDVTGGNFFPQASDASGRSIAVGPAAAGAAVAGNPLLMGVSDGTNVQQVRSSSANPNSLLVQAGSAVSFADALTSMGRPTYIAGGNAGWMSQGYLYNGTTADLARSNEDRILLASALRSGTSGPTALITYNHRAVYFILDTTVHTGSGIVKLVVDYIDPASGKAINLLTGANVSTVTTNVYKIGIGLTAAANLVAVEYLARNLQWTVTLVSGTSVTYSLGCCLMPA